MAQAKDCHVLTTYFEKKYKEHYNGNSVLVNRNTARWSWDSVLETLSVSEAKSLVDYYFKTSSPSRHSIVWFFNNYDKLLNGMKEELDDKAHREKLRRESEERARRWRERFGNQGITSN